MGKPGRKGEIMSVCLLGLNEKDQKGIERGH